MEKPIVVITGPTGSGKTALSLEMAKEFGGEIICADSMTVYKYFDIGTDKVTKISNFKFQISNSIPRVDGVPHHLVDILEPEVEFNVAIFQKMARKKVKEIHDRGNIPFIVGGTLLYIDSLIYSYEMPSAKPDNQLRGSLGSKSIEELQKMIETKKIHIAKTELKNKRRLIRAIEIAENGDAQPQKNPITKNILYLAIGKERAELYKNINKRVESMMDQGLLDEVKSLVSKYSLTKPFEAPGYKELKLYLSDKISLDQAVEKTKQAHRNYVKRQMTWLRKNPDVIWIENEKEAKIIIKNFLDKV